MNSDTVRDEIARLEARIEQLDDSIERCRKLSLAAKLAIGSGAAWIALTLMLIVNYVPALTFAALAAVIGGVVLLGSNSTTWTQMAAARAAAETQRADLIGGLELRAVDSGVRRLH
jgi:hypothetical protein